MSMTSVSRLISYIVYLKYNTLELNQLFMQIRVTDIMQMAGVFD